jgi:hypothetical protein
MIIHEMKMPYAIDMMGPGPEPSVACATEDHGPMVRIDPPYRQARPLVSGPGGCMSLAYDPSRPSDLYAVMGCFVGYKFQGAAIYRIREGGEPERVVDLPFAHRIGFARKGGRQVLLAASLAAGKKDPSDWSLPGGVYAIEIGDDLVSGSTLEPVLTSIHKNHGFLLAALGGRRTLLIGASEGLLAVDLEEEGPGWSTRQLLTGETSEVAAFDLDGDGEVELVTIEPFHGSALRAYRKATRGWQVFWEAELEFGHCVLAGMVEGRRSVLVSSRAGRKELLLFQFGHGVSAKPRRIVVDEGAGAANMLILSSAGRDHILSANQAAGQIVMYSPHD